MIKPKRLTKGDRVALVSLSSGMGGDTLFSHRTMLGKKRLEEMGLIVKCMPNAMKGTAFLDKHPEKRAEDFMAAFLDREVKGIFCMIGGDDTIRLLPFIDFSVISKNPKIFIGYSDTTINHFMMYKAGVTSFYGPSILAEFAENGAMHSYTKEYFQKVIFDGQSPLSIVSSPEWTSEFLEWSKEENNHRFRKMVPEKRGYELLQGQGVVRGKLLGGCVDVFPMIIGSTLWPTLDRWENTILFLETSEDYPTPSTLKYLLRSFVAQGIVEKLKGIIFGKPRDETYYEEYKEVFKQVIAREAGRQDLPILYNMNFGHASPICTLPYGTLAEIDCEKTTFTLLEPSVEI